MDCQAGIHAVEGTVPARYFDETRSTWDQTTISVFYDDARHVTLMGGHGRGKASVRMTREEFEPLVDALREGRSHLIKDLDTGEILELFRVHSRQWSVYPWHDSQLLERQCGFVGSDCPFSSG